MAPVQVSSAQLKTLIDGIFTGIEAGNAGHPIVVALLKAANVAADTAGLPALEQYLVTKGIITLVP